MKIPEIVAEFTINHLGMVKIVLATLQRCKEIGVDLAKFKVKDVSKYYQKDGKKFNGYDFIDYRASLELAPQDFEVIDNWCKEHGMKWFATSHDPEGVQFLSKFDPPYYKIASMDALNDKLFDEVFKVNSSKKPLIVSIGGLDDAKTEKIVRRVTDSGLDLILLHTVSIYPTPVDKCNIAAIQRLKRNYGSERVKIGYSGHEIGYVPTLLAVQAGAEMIERHITLTREMNLHHLKAALTTDEFEAMVDDINKVVGILNVEDRHYFEEEHKFLTERQYD
jgi:sialic acid synthase SpsE